jgi:transcription antitermination factor NusA-like protein
MCCEIYINGKNTKIAFSLLETEKEDIEAVIGTSLSRQREVTRGSVSRVTTIPH